MWEPFFGFKKTPFSDNPDGKQLFASQGWNQVNARLQFLVEHHAIGLLTGEVGAGKSTAARSFIDTLNHSLYKILYLTLLLVGQPLLRRTLSLQLHEALRQRIAVHYHLEGLTREELDAYLAYQLKAAGISQPLFDDTATQALYQATKGILRKVNKLAV